MNSDRIYYSHDAKMHAMRNRTLLTLGFLAFGLGIGAVLALLFAPTSGKKARHELAKGVEEGLKTGRESIEPLVKRVEDEFAELHKNVEERLK